MVSRMPSVHRVNTSVAPSFSATSTSGQSASSVAPSPYFGSLQSSPLVLQSPGQSSQLGSPGPLELPESIVSASQSAYFKDGSMGSAASSKPAAIVRKLSQSAKDGVSRRILRRKASSSTQGRRDESTGPITRRRSDSKTMGSNGTSLDPSATEPFPMDLQVGLGLSDAMSISSEPTLIDTSPEGQAPTVPERLVRGCTLIKITKNKRQEKVFFLDVEGSRVSWRGAVTTKSFHIDNIKSIRNGEEAASYQQELRSEELDPDRCLSISYAASDSSKQVKTLHLVARNHADLRLWVETLESLAKHREELMTSMVGSAERESVIRAHWDNEMGRRGSTTSSNSGKMDGLDLPAIQSLCRKLHIHSPVKDLEENFHDADVDHSGLLDYDQFKDFLRRLRERRDIQDIFNGMKESGRPGITRAQFVAFLENSQGVKLASASAGGRVWEDKIDQVIAASFPDDAAARALADIDANAFTSFIVSKDCHVYATAAEPTPSFDRPLNEYFISSSHNTYLTGWQVGGSSSAEAYMTALRHGCRCVEIDCWNGQDGHPRVTHGHTKTSAVLFSDCINAINRCAFDVSPYPLIISLEVHCDPEQQKKMVHTMEDVFGDRLLLHPPEDAHRLPSPEQLKYKILVKVKATEVYADLTALRQTLSSGRERSASSPQWSTAPSVTGPSPMVPTALSPSLTTPPETTYSPTDRSVTATSASSSSSEESDVQTTTTMTTMTTMTSSTTRTSLSRAAGTTLKSSSYHHHHHTSKITPYLSNLGVYLKGYSLREPRDLLLQQFNHIFSLNENRATALCHPPENKILFEDHNVHYMCRVYPKTIRIHSTNFDPNAFWKRGVQMVALNWQTFDAHMQMNQAMFAAGTDAYGYVLKPDYLRTPRTKTGDFEHRVKLPRYRMRFSVQVISAQQLPRPPNVGKNDPLNPFIEVQMFSAEDKARGIANGSGGQESKNAGNGYHGIGSPYRRRTKIVWENGYNPQFGETFELSLETKYPQLVFVRFIVFNSPDGRYFGKNCKQLAAFTAKLDSLQKGYRHLPLYNGHGEEFIFSTLFCRFTKQDSILMSSSLQDVAEPSPRPSRLRGILSRGLSSDRSRERSASIEEKQVVAQLLKLNPEMEGISCDKVADP